MYKLEEWQLSVISRIIHITMRKRLLELGSGASTKLFDDLLMQGIVDDTTSIEHNIYYAPATDRATITICPLSSDGFYNLKNFYATATGKKAYDFILIDGPPDHSGESSRKYAIPRLRPWLSRDAIGIVDDMHREGNREQYMLWEASNLVRTIHEYSRDFSRKKMTLFKIL